MGSPGPGITRCSWANRPELPALLTKLPQLAQRPRRGGLEDGWLDVDGDGGRCGEPFLRPQHEISQAESGNSVFLGGWAEFRWKDEGNQWE